MQALIPAAEMQPKQMPPNKFPGAAHAMWLCSLLRVGGSRSSNSCTWMIVRPLVSTLDLCRDRGKVVCTPDSSLLPQVLTGNHIHLGALQKGVGLQAETLAW